jgi:hypothetical protein
LSDYIYVFRAYNPITRSIDLDPASLQTRYTISRAMKAFQGGKQYKPGKALRMLKKHQKNKLPEDEAKLEDDDPKSLKKMIEFEFETSETKFEKP